MNDDTIADTWKRNEIDSPCVNICVIHPEAKICVGCHRTADEISSWSIISQAERDRIRTDLESRAPMLRTRRGGRAKRRLENPPKL
ncbi:MAG: DUF1289 domain-containing protein [Paracoccaceae bacterium]